jgi:hypothetical protein
MSLPVVKKYSVRKQVCQVCREEKRIETFKHQNVVTEMCTKCRNKQCKEQEKEEQAKLIAKFKTLEIQAQNQPSPVQVPRLDRSPLQRLDIEAEDHPSTVKLKVLEIEYQEYKRVSEEKYEQLFLLNRQLKETNTKLSVTENITNRQLEATKAEMLALQSQLNQAVSKPITPPEILNLELGTVPSSFEAKKLNLLKAANHINRGVKDRRPATANPGGSE